MDPTPTYRAYTITYEPPAAALARYSARTGSRPTLAVAHPRDQATLRAVMPPTVTIDTAAHGGPHPGELWLA